MNFTKADRPHCCPAYLLVGHAACIVFHLSELHHHDRQSYHRHVRLHPGNDYHEDLDIHFNFNYDTTPLWYLYMLVGLYFIIPIFHAWLERATRKDIKLFLSIWGISLFLPYIKMAAPALGYIGNWGNMDILGVCDWNAFGSFYYVSGFTGYLILAHYLVKYPLQWSWRKTLAIGIPMFVTGYAITFGGYLIMQEYFPGNYAYLEIVWLFGGINVFMMTFPVLSAYRSLKYLLRLFFQKWHP